MKILKRVGIVSILLSIVYYLLIDGLTYIGPFILITGIILLILSLIFHDVDLRIQILLSIIPFAVGIGYLIYETRPFKQMIILPENYTGIVLIGYGFPNGQKEEWRNGCRLIRVDNSGIALTQFKVKEYSTGDIKFFYQGSVENNKNEIPNFLSLNEENNSQVNFYYVDIPNEDCQNMIGIYIFDRPEKFTQYFKSDSSFYLKENYSEFIRSKINKICNL